MALSSSLNPRRKDSVAASPATSVVIPKRAEEEEIERAAARGEAADQAEVELVRARRERLVIESFMVVLDS